MMAGGRMSDASRTTEREVSTQDAPPAHLCIKWVWPLRRVEILQGSRLSLGRDEKNAIRLDGIGVSRLHAELYRQGPLYVLHDLGSTNGTWLGGRPIVHAPVVPDSVIRIGEWVGVFSQDMHPYVEFGELAPGIFGGGEIAALLEPLRRAASSNVPVLLIGDTGSGKERFARAAHEFSGREGPFIAVNCAALPEQLAEGELFGYRRGAFTGAERAHPGVFRAVHGGTLFLDEMPELSPNLQAKLLRVVEDGEVTGLGEGVAVKVDVRIVSASQTPLALLVAEKRLRQDLAARLTGVELRLPALSMRRSDIVSLFVEFLKRQSGGRTPMIDARVAEALSLHSWPQNVRELQMLTRTLLAVHGHEPKLLRQHLPENIGALCQGRSRGESKRDLPRVRSEYDLERLERELSVNGGSVKEAARALGISRQRIYRLLDGRTEGERNPTGNGVDN
jgi:transcriptional regulator of acetoin/glycerol metabolism